MRPHCLCLLYAVGHRERRSPGRGPRLPVDPPGLPRRQHSVPDSLTNWCPARDTAGGRGTCCPVNWGGIVASGRSPQTGPRVKAVPGGSGGVGGILGTRRACCPWPSLGLPTPTPSPSPDPDPGSSFALDSSNLEAHGAEASLCERQSQAITTRINSKLPWRGHPLPLCRPYVLVILFTLNTM